MRNGVAIAGALVVSLVVSDCAMRGASENETKGAVAGSAIGAAAGLAIPYGGGVLLSLAGGIVGSRIGGYLDDKEKQEMAEASVRAAADAKTGERVGWGGPIPSAKPKPTAPGKAKSPERNSARASGGRVVLDSTAKSSKADVNAAAGWVVPLSDTYVTPKGQTCRDLQQVATKSGNTYREKIQACQSAQGWIIPQA